MCRKNLPFACKRITYSKLFMVVSLSKMLVLVTFHILCNAILVLCMIKIVMVGSKE